MELGEQFGFFSKNTIWSLNSHMFIWIFFKKMHHRCQRKLGAIRLY